MQEYDSIIENKNNEEILVENILEYKKGFTLTKTIKKISKNNIEISRNIFLQRGTGEKPAQPVLCQLEHDSKFEDV